MNEATIQLRDKGVITLPMSLRRKYSLRTGDVFSVRDLGEGVLMISPKSSRVAALGDKVADILRAEGVSVKELLEGLNEERKRYYREHFERKAIASMPARPASLPRSAPAPAPRRCALARGTPMAVKRGGGGRPPSIDWLSQRPKRGVSNRGGRASERPGGFGMRMKGWYQDGRTEISL